MARTVDQIVQEALGAQSLTICRLQAELELLMAKVAELEAAAQKQGQADG